MRSVDEQLEGLATLAKAVGIRRCNFSYVEGDVACLRVGGVEVVYAAENYDVWRPSPGGTPQPIKFGLSFDAVVRLLT
jgi:hypothetical protein